MKRVMVNLDDVSGEILKQRASSDRRSVSSYVGTLIERDLCAAGMIKADDQRSAVLAAAEEVGLDKAISVLRRTSRTKKSAA